MNVAKTSLVALIAALLAGCGGIDSVDSTLATGRVQGKLSNAKPGAYVYVFGHPEIRSQVESDGSYRLDKVPVGNGKAQVVLYDGGELGAGKAELHDAEVHPAEHRTLDRDARDMPFAGSLVAVAQCKGGQKGDKTTYAIDGTEFDGKKGGGETFRMYPLPAGVTLRVKGSLKGFKDGIANVTVVEKDELSVGIELDVDGSDSAKGCLSAACGTGLSCDDDDGYCYECSKHNGAVTGCESKPGTTCEEHVCVPAGAGDLRSACLPCTSDGQCSPFGSGLCIPASNGVGKVCSRSCATDLDCPSGHACGTAPDGRTACVAAPSCSDVLQAFGQVCFDDVTCPTSLADAHCQGADRHNNVAGYCTSRCTVQADCPTALGFSCVAGTCQR